MNTKDLFKAIHDSNNTGVVGTREHIKKAKTTSTKKNLLDRVYELGALLEDEREDNSFGATLGVGTGPVVVDINAEIPCRQGLNEAHGCSTEGKDGLDALPKDFGVELKSVTDCLKDWQWSLTKTRTKAGQVMRFWFHGQE